MSPHQTSVAWLQLTAGRGPLECSCAVAGVVPHLEKAAKKAGLAAHILEVTETTNVPKQQISKREKIRSLKTISSVLFSIEGPSEGLERFIEQWVGSIQWIATSPFRPTHKRRNWFMACHAYQPPHVGHSLSLSEVTFQTMRGSGPGGQHVNTTDSAVRATHTPTGLSAVAREERSQHRNKQLALARLAEALASQANKAQTDAESDRWLGHTGLVRGNAVQVFEGYDFRQKA